MTFVINFSMTFLIPAVIIVILRFIGIKLQTEILEKIPSRFGIFLLAPGTIIHELSHFLMAKLFMLQVTEMRLFKYEPETGNLGYVNLAYNRASIRDRIGVSFTGFAPIIGVSSVNFLIYYFLFPDRIKQISNDIVSNNNVLDIFISVIRSMLAIHLNDLFKVILFIFLSTLLLSGLSISDKDIDSIKAGLVWVVIISLLLTALTCVIPFLSAFILQFVVILSSLTIILIIISVIDYFIMRLIP